jgi:hypothetical protein
MDVITSPNGLVVNKNLGHTPATIGPFRHGIPGSLIPIDAVLLELYAFFPQ